MANLYLFNPANKLRFLSTLVLQVSKRILRNIQPQMTKIPDLDAERTQAKFNIKVFDLVDTDLRHVHASQEGLFRDMEYYKDEKDAGLCVFRVENTLFKVQLAFTSLCFAFLRFVNCVIAILLLLRFTNVICFANHVHLLTCLVFLS